MASPDEIRDAQRATWDALSTSWDKWDSVIMEQLRPVGNAMIASLGIAEDQHHLDIATGTGEPGLTIATLAPKGRVVLTDLAAQMLDVATRRAQARGITNVEARVCSADDLPFDDAAFDSVSIRFGYMFLPDPARATDEMVRVLVPGGRLASSVWVRPADNPWTSVALAAVASEVELPAPEPDAPSMFRFAAPGAVRALYEAAGLHDIHEHDVVVDLVTASRQEYWRVMSEHVSLIAAALRGVDDAARARIADRAADAIGAYQQDDGSVRVPGAARVIVGTR